MLKLTTPSRSIDSSVDTDVVVVGAGPAGAAAAHYIASSGLNVVLVDRQKFPREKVCGDFVGPVGLRELKNLGVARFPEYRKTNIITDASIHLNGKKLISRSIPWIDGLLQHGRVIPRKMLDNWILDSAREVGARISEGAFVTGFKTRKDRVDVFLEESTGMQAISAKLLIGADGSNSLVAKILRGNPPPLESQIIGVRGYFEKVEGPENEAGIYFNSESFPGYTWLFPMSDHTANVGTGMLVETIPKGENLRELLMRLINRDPALHNRLRNAKLTDEVSGWPLSIYNPTLPLVADKVILIGDAAGLINPINGEGIQYALLSARWASEVALSCAAKNDFSQQALMAYSNRVESELRYDFALSNFVVQLIRNRALNPIWLRMLEIIASRARIDPDYAQVMSGILAGLVGSSDVVDVKIIQGTLEQAAISTSLRIILGSVRGPGHMANIGKSTVQTGFEIARNIVQNPASFIKWGVDSVVSASELGLQVAKHSLHETSPKKKSAAVILKVD